jgi:methyltransferase-like protein/predicted O-methyltransferase YrrM
VKTTATKECDLTNTSSVHEIPDESYPFPQSHPDRLATLATLFGMNPQPVDNCRVLELGCASGGNIIPMAYGLPHSRFVGVEINEQYVADALAAIKDLKMENIEIKHQNVVNLDKDLGTFDYIIAHGLYSYVPDHIRERLLQIIQDRLNPNGIAYISYNTYPGWHNRGTIRDMLLYRTAQLSDPQAKVEQARTVLDILAATIGYNDAYDVMLRSELDLVRQQKDYHFFNDYLGETNSAVYFHQLAEAAARHDLQYLAEAEFSTMLTGNFSPEIQETLKSISNDLVMTEQQMDFFRNRAFRQTLLCRKDIVLNRNLTAQSMMSLEVACPAVPEFENFEPQSHQPERFFVDSDRFFTSTYPLVKAAFRHLYSIWPQSISFDDLYTTACSYISPLTVQDATSFDHERQTLAGDLLNCFAANIVVLRSQKIPVAREILEKPKVSGLVRRQAEQEQSSVTNLLHESVLADSLSWHILRLMDGSRDRNELLDELVELAKDSVLTVMKDGDILSTLFDDDVFREALQPAMDEHLAQIKKSALLCQ